MVNMCWTKNVCFIFLCNFCPKHVSLLQIFNDLHSRCARRFSCKISDCFDFYCIWNVSTNVNKTFRSQFFKIHSAVLQLLHVNIQTLEDTRNVCNSVIYEPKKQSASSLVKCIFPNNNKNNKNKIESVLKFVKSQLRE
jgi:hypothetical protein